MERGSFVAYFFLVFGLFQSQRSFGMLSQLFSGEQPLQEETKKHDGLDLQVGRRHMVVYPRRAMATSVVLRPAKLKRSFDFRRLHVLFAAEESGELDAAQFASLCFLVKEREAQDFRPPKGILIGRLPRQFVSDGLTKRLISHSIETCDVSIFFKTVLFSGPHDANKKGMCKCEDCVAQRGAVVRSKKGREQSVFERIEAMEQYSRDKFTRCLRVYGLLPESSTVSTSNEQTSS